MELVLSIMDELTEELIKEGWYSLPLPLSFSPSLSLSLTHTHTHTHTHTTEQALLAQYEEDLRFTEDALCEAVQSLYTDELICPICQK